MGNKRCVNDEDLPLLFRKEVDWIQILVWLPVVSLLRFKSVCKSWRALIKSPYFIDLHTATTFNSSSSKLGSFILHASVERYEPPRFCKKLIENAVLMLSSSDESEWLSKSGSGSGSGCWWWSQLNHLWPTIKFDDYSYSDTDDQVFKVEDDDDQLVLKLDNLGFPPCYELDDCLPIDILGSCNGLVCLYNQRNNQFTFWNPATRQFRNLPKTISCILPNDCLAGFCFDAETKDYKVVLFNNLNEKSSFYGKWGPDITSECFCRVQVYSLSTDSWRLLEGITCLPGDPFSKRLNHGKLLYLNGCFFVMALFLHSAHQKCFPDNDRFMISFDLSKEIITPIQLPNHHRNDKLYLSYLGDKIALFTAPHVYDNDTNMYTYHDFKAQIYSNYCEDSDDEGLEDEIDTDYANYEVGDTGICNDEGLKAEIDTDNYEDGDTGICNDEGLKAGIDTDNYEDGDTGICNDEGLKAEIDTDNYEDGDTGICNDEGLKAEIDTDNYEDGDTGMCNDEGLKAEIDTDNYEDGDNGISSDEDGDNGISSDEDLCSVSTDERESYGYEDFNIWVLNEHGISISTSTSTNTSSVNMEYWKRLHSFRVKLENPGDWNLPRGISNDGKFALLETKHNTILGKKMKLFNLLDKEVKNNFLYCSEVMSKATAYKPSLVSIIGGNGAGAAATYLKQEIESTVILWMDDKLHCKSYIQHFPMVAAPSMYN